jgi:hypothetical protein
MKKDIWGRNEMGKIRRNILKMVILFAVIMALMAGMALPSLRRHTYRNSKLAYSAGEGPQHFKHYIFCDKQR